MKVRKLLAAAGVAGLVTVGLTALPAEATTWGKICNHGLSAGPVLVYSTHTSYRSTVTGSYCRIVDNSNNGIRVDVDPGLGPDVDSYKYCQENGGPCNPCSVGESGNSDPPDKWLNDDSRGVFIRTYRSNNCTGEL